MTEQQHLTHIDEKGDVRMVDVSEKDITKAKVECEPVHAGEREDGRVGIHVTTTTGVTGKTGIEMEALTAASVACLTIYDMCKAVDKGMELSGIHLVEKTGGKSGHYIRSEGGYV